MSSTIKQIKATLGVQELNFTGFQQDWYSTFHSEERRLIACHKDIYDLIKSDPKINTLFLKTEEKVGPKGAYTLYVICKSNTVVVGSL